MGGLSDIGGALGVLNPATALGVGASLGGAYLGYKGVGDTNVANKDIASARNAMEIEEAKKARDFSGFQAKINRDFQERMSSSAVQRRMADMKKAGINPILAGKFDASSPAGGIGATAKANAHGYEAKNKLQGLLDNMGSALGLKKVISEIQNLNASTAFTQRKTDLTEPINRMMDILDKMIQGGAGNAQDYKRYAEQVREDILDLKGYIDGTHRREAEKIRNSPGVELTPKAKKDLPKAQSLDKRLRGQGDFPTNFRKWWNK